MKTEDNGVVVLSRGDALKHNPSLEDVIALMSRVMADDGLGDAPEIALKQFDARAKSQKYKTRMLIVPAFSASARTKWIVDFTIANSKDGSLLARHMPTDEEFEVRTTVGVLTAYRPVCLLDDGPIIHDAIEWFLRFHTQNPNLHWVNYWDAVRHF